MPADDIKSKPKENYLSDSPDGKKFAEEMKKMTSNFEDVNTAYIILQNLPSKYTNGDDGKIEAFHATLASEIISQLCSKNAKIFEGLKITEDHLKLLSDKLAYLRVCDQDRKYVMPQSARNGAGLFASYMAEFMGGRDPVDRICGSDSENKYIVTFDELDKHKSGKSLNKIHRDPESNQNKRIDKSKLKERVMKAQLDIAEMIADDLKSLTYNTVRDAFSYIRYLDRDVQQTVKQYVKSNLGIDLPEYSLQNDLNKQTKRVFTRCSKFEQKKDKKNKAAINTSNNSLIGR